MSTALARRPITFLPVPPSPFEAGKREAAHQARMSIAVRLAVEAATRLDTAKVNLKAAQLPDDVERPKLLDDGMDRLREARALIDQIITELEEG